MFEELMRKFRAQGVTGDPYRVSTNRLPMELGSSNNSMMGMMGQKVGGLLGLNEPGGPDPMTLNQNNMPTPTFATANAPQYGTTDSALSGNPTESSGPLKDAKTDWKGMADGLGSIADGITGADQTPIKAPQIADDTAQRAAAASQLWQSVMNKRKPKGLI
jgi:hypothetical protein